MTAEAPEAGIDDSILLKAYVSVSHKTEIIITTLVSKSAMMDQPDLDLIHNTSFRRIYCRVGRFVKSGGPKRQP